MKRTFTVDEGQRQILLLALAKLSLERPGWEYALDLIAAQLQGREMYESFRVDRADTSSGSEYGPE
jgi:hypothetical protein